jgi:hypothetical protein
MQRTPEKHQTSDGVPQTLRSFEIDKSPQSVANSLRLSDTGFLPQKWRLNKWD